MKVFNFVTLIASLLVFSGCADTVIIEKYSNIDEAREAGAIARGWLPDWLPSSTTNITEKHDLDTNRSVSIFQVPLADRKIFVELCEPTKNYEPPIYFLAEFQIITQETDKFLLCDDQFALLGEKKVIMWRP